MKYNQSTFDSAVGTYRQLLGDMKGKLLFAVVELEHRDAFFSLAPLSKAVHDLGGEMQATIKDGKSANLPILMDAWKTYDHLKAGKDSQKVAALKGFLDAANARMGNERLDVIFQRPELIISSTANGFDGSLKLPLQVEWCINYRWEKLLEVAAKLWKEAYALKKKDSASISLALVPSELDLPLEDYLDSFSIAYAMALEAKKICRVSLGGSSDKPSMLDNAVRTGELSSTLLGCEFDKDINEDVFQKFKALSDVLHIRKMKYSTAVFGIHGKGYAGKFLFGDKIGFPTPNGKTRWSSTGQMFLKDRFETQTYEDSRDPRMRYALTETLPIDEFIETNDIDIPAVRAVADKIKDTLDKCEQVHVIGGRTDFTVFLTSGSRRNLFNSMNYDVNTAYDKPFFKKTGIKAGLYANIPDGETFVTPIRITGRIVGDVVVSLDRSTVIPKDNPLVIDVDEEGNYKITSGAPDIIATMQRLKGDAMKRLATIEASKALPVEMTEMYRRNFNHMGEFAVNVNPKAKLSRYLIVNEKLAGMIHVAMGLGFEPDTKTLYHWDVVVDAPSQQLDIYGIDKDGKKHYVMEKGRLVV